MSPRGCAALLSILALCFRFARGEEPRILTDEQFPADEFILSQARFWFDIYLRVSEQEGLLHHRDLPHVVYRRISAGKAGSRAARNAVRREAERLEAELLALARGDSGAWGAEQRALRRRLPDDWDSAALADAAKNIRFQRGLKERFRKGVERSYRYLDMIDSTFAEIGVPRRLKYLPHVESSFYPHAYSKVGAAGMWQFMKSSGRRYLKIGYHVDERRDPYAATRAAGRLLAHNYEKLGSWPLALVAYNHGAGGMARAARETGTRDLGEIVARYRSRTFGFASKNFYAEFLAASTIAMMAESLYGDLDKWEPLRFTELVLEKSLSPLDICRLTGMSLVMLEEYNLSLRPATFRRNAAIPQGFALRLPAEIPLEGLADKLFGTKLAAAVPADTGAAAPADHVESRSPARVAVKAPAKAAKEAAIKKPARAGPVLTEAGKVSPLPVSAKATSADALVEALAGPVGGALERAEESDVENTFLLQSSDLDRLAHPMDRFRPEVYRLGHRFEDDMLFIWTGSEETMSHYVEWSGVPSHRIRALNRLRSSRHLRMNRELRLPLRDTAAVAAFVARRERHYRAIEEDFYANYYVSALQPMTVERGFSLWLWSHEQQIPFWLLQKHNPGTDLQNLHPGDLIQIPIIETGIRRWGFTRYGDTGEYFQSIAVHLGREAM